MSTQDTKLMAQQWIEEIWDRGNVSLMDEMCGEDYAREGPVTGDVAADEPLATKSWVADLRYALPDLHVTEYDIIAEKKKAAIPFTARGTHRREFRTYPPTGRAIEWQGVMVLEVKKKRICRFWFDPCSLLAQLRPDTRGPHRAGTGR